MNRTTSLPILQDVRRTDKTLTLISKQDDGTHVFNCGLGDAFYYGLQLVSVGNSLGSDVLTTIALTCRDESGTFYYYEVWTDQPGKFLPFLQKPRQYPVLDSIFCGDDYLTLEYHNLEGESGQLTLGVFSDLYRYTWKTYATNWIAAHRFDAAYLSFISADEASKRWEHTFTAEVEQIKQYCEELNAYIKSFGPPKPRTA